MLLRLPMALAQVKAGNTSENLLNEIHQIIYCLYWAKEFTKIMYNNIVVHETEVENGSFLWINMLYTKILQILCRLRKSMLISLKV